LGFLDPFLEEALRYWTQLYAWASGQPVFIQVAVGAAIVIVGGYLCFLTLGLALTFIAWIFSWD
jgi:small-conductance mechanosensitive channel